MVNQGLGWFQEVITLSQPYVPVSPDIEWWNSDLLAIVQASMYNPTAITGLSWWLLAITVMWVSFNKSLPPSALITVLLTGRTILYEEVITRLFNYMNLEFDEIGLKSPPDMRTMQFKQEFILKLIDKYKPSKVNIWEDRPRHVEQFTRFLESTKVEFYVHKVSMRPMYLEEKMERELVAHLLERHGKDLVFKEIVEYTGVHLNKESHRKLLELFPPKQNWAKKAHHMTMCLGEIGETTFPAGVEKESYRLGREVELEVVAYGEDEKASAVKVVCDVPTLNKIPHVTVSISPIGKPVDSNAIEKWIPVRLKGDASRVEGEEEVIGVEEKIKLKGIIKQSVKFALLAKAKPSPVKTGINFGQIILKHHPHISGPQIGKSVALLRKWIQETQQSDVVVIEEYVKTLVIE